MCSLVETPGANQNTGQVRYQCLASLPCLPCVRGSNAVLAGCSASRGPRRAASTAAWARGGVGYTGARRVGEALATPQFELGVCVLVVVSVAKFALETLPAFGSSWAPSFDEVTTIAFALEYLARWYSRSLRPTYLFKPLMIIDLASFLPYPGNRAFT